MSDIRAPVAGEKCGGVNIAVVDRNAIRPVAIGLQMAHTLRRLYPEKWEVDAIDRLLINKAALEALRNGADAAAIEKMMRPEFEEFLQRRVKYLLYAR